MTDASGRPGAPVFASREVLNRGGGAPRVCILLESMGGGGIETTAVTQCRSLLDAGCEVDLLRLKRGDWILRRVPGGARTMLVQEAAQHPGKIARFFSSAPPSGSRGSFREQPPLQRRLRRALDVLLHIRTAALTRNGLRALLRIWKLNRRAAREKRRADILSLARTVYFAACAASLSRYIEQAKPDALYSALTTANITALLARRMTAHKPRLVASIHSRLRGGGRNEAGAKLALLSALLPEADAVHAVSAGLADETAQKCGVSRKAVAVLHNPAFHKGLSDLKLQPAPHPWVAQKGGEKVILWAGRVAHAKDPQTLLRAFRILRRRRKARLILLGVPKGTGREMARRLAGDVAESILCPGFVENPFAWMAGADVFVLCSRWEGFGNVLVEAMACGCPVVSADCPHGPREILEDGRWGRLTPVGDAQALADAINETLENPLPAEQLIARARDFSEERIMPQWMEMLGVLHPAAGAPPAADGASAEC